MMGQNVSEEMLYVVTTNISYVECGESWNMPIMGSSNSGLKQSGSFGWLKTKGTIEDMIGLFDNHEGEVQSWIKQQGTRNNVTSTKRSIMP